MCYIGKQSVWLLEHVTGIAATRRRTREGCGGKGWGNWPGKSPDCRPQDE